MSGDEIPKITQYTIHCGGGMTKDKVPQYTLKTSDEIKDHQKRLGENASWYYGTNCVKCCGVYPSFQTEENMQMFGYYVCLVCGKESLHEPTPWQCRNDWNAGRYKWEPETMRQLTIFDFIGG